MSGLKIVNHWLEGPNVEHIKLDGKTKGKFEKHLPDMLVYHYTAALTAGSSIGTFQNPKTKSSCHYLIDRDGKIIQFIPFNYTSWHAGVSSYMGRKWANNYSIGCELVNAGPLTKTSRGTYTTWYGAKVPDDQVITEPHKNDPRLKHWQTYTEAQLFSAMCVQDVIDDHYTIKYVTGHEEIAPDRKTDPGPAFPLARFRSILNQDRADEIDDDESVRTVDSPDGLNFRSSPGVDDNIIGSLEDSLDVKVIEENFLDSGWVKIQVEGYVNKKFLKSKGY